MNTKNKKQEINCTCNICCQGFVGNNAPYTSTPSHAWLGSV